MSKSNTFENQFLKLIFNGDAIAGIAQNNTTSPNTSLWLALHTADPGEDGNQSTNEVSYTGYARMGVARTTEGWLVNGNSVNPKNPVDFPEVTAGSGGTATYITIGTAQTGSGTVLYRGSLTPAIYYGVGVIPRLKSTSTITEE